MIFNPFTSKYCLVPFGIGVVLTSNVFNIKNAYIHPMQVSLHTFLAINALKMINKRQSVLSTVSVGVSFIAVSFLFASLMDVTQRLSKNLHFKIFGRYVASSWQLKNLSNRPFVIFSIVLLTFIAKTATYLTMDNLRSCGVKFPYPVLIFFMFNFLSAKLLRICFEHYDIILPGQVFLSKDPKLLLLQSNFKTIKKSNNIEKPKFIIPFGLQSFY